MSSAYFNSENVAPYLRCQVSGQPLLEAVNLVPCNHKIQKEIAKKVFGDPVSAGWKIAKGLSCPVCQQGVKGYLIDSEMRTVATEVFGTVDYPGERSIFIHKKGDFKISPLKDDRCRFMKFTATKKTALIQKFELLGFKNGAIKIWIAFDRTKGEEFSKFLNKNGGIELGRFGRYSTNNKRQLRSLFEIIFKNNIFPVEHHQRLNQIIAAGKKPPLKSSKAEEFSEMPPCRDFLSQMMRRDQMFRDMVFAGALRTLTALEPIAYPGLPGTFNHVEGDFEPFTPDLHLCRKMFFKSETPNCLIHTLKFLGYIQGFVKIQIEFDPSHSENIVKFFAGVSSNVAFSIKEKEQGFYRTNTKEDLKIVFEVVKANNTLPIEFLPKMEAIVAEGSIPPMPGNEERESELECRTQ